FTTLPCAVSSPLRTLRLTSRFPFTGPAPSGVSQVDPPLGALLGEVAVHSGAARGTTSGGAEPGGAETGGAEPGGAKTDGIEPGDAETGGAEPGGAEPEGVEPEGAESEGSESGGAEPQGAASFGATGGGGAGAAGVGGARVPTGARVTGGSAAIGPGGARTQGNGAARTGGVGGVGAGDPTESGAAEAGGSGTGDAGGSGVGGSQLPLQSASLLPAPSPSIKQSGGLTERHEPASRPARCVPRSRPPPIPSTHAMALRPSSVPLHVPLVAPPESSLPAIPDPDLLLHLPSLLSCLNLLLEFAAACRLDYTTALVAKSASASPPSVGGEWALTTDVVEDMQQDFECLAAVLPRFASMLLAPEGDPDAPDIPTPRSYAEAIMGPYSSQWQAAMDAKMASWKSTGPYVDEVPPIGENIVDGMWLFRHQEVDYFQTFSPTQKMTTLRELLHVAAQRDYELHSLDFSTAFLQGSLHEEIWLRRPPGFTGSFPAGTHKSLRRPVYGLRQSPREWHDTLRTTLVALGFAPATADPSLFLRTVTLLPPFYVLVYVDDLVFATADTKALTLVKSELQKRHTCTDLGPSALRLPVLLATAHMGQPDLAYPLSLLARYVAPGRHRKVHWNTAKRVLHYLCSTSGMGLILGGRGPVVLTGHADASWVDDSATQRLSQGYTFSLGSGSVSWRSTCSSSVLSSICEAEIYPGAMAAQELCWLTYLLTDLGEQPHSLPVLTKYIALRYFLARELQQRGQLRLAYVATRANTADVFTKALPPGDHQRLSTVLGLVPTLPHLLTA
ncbi:unnamed protein product, partial [Closterium sp. NIES-53]